ncbi:uncharacterized protein LOC144103503 [Amblyomma americanum]
MEKKQAQPKRRRSPPTSGRSPKHPSPHRCHPAATPPGPGRAGPRHLGPLFGQSPRRRQASPATLGHSPARSPLCQRLLSTPPARGPEPPAAQAPRQPPRDVATWTYQAGTYAPVGYVSWRPWKRQERAKRLTPPARLFNVFRGRTVADADQRAEGVSLPLSPGTLLCPCGAVMLHEEAHKAGDLHDQRTRGATTRDDRHPAAATPSAAARQMLARAGREAEFAEWLLQVAARHAGGPPEPSLGSQPSAAMAPPSSAAAPPAPSDEARDPDPKRPAPALAAAELPAPDMEAGATPAGGLEMDLDLWSTEIE